MYFPYFRGKQFELSSIRETADVLAGANFVPIVEPVRQALGGVARAIDAMLLSGGQAIVIVNPRHGDFKEDGATIEDMLQEHSSNDAISPAVLLRSETEPSVAVAMVGRFAERPLTVIHDGFTDAPLIAGVLAKRGLPTRNVFVEEQANMLYRRRFMGSERVLVRDGFERKKNADYARLDNFSDLHATFASDLGMNGFGDFLTVGDYYSEAGGPAYAVAIHLTFIDPALDDAMMIYHFVSDTNDTPTDPAGKFAQALAKLMYVLDSGSSNLVETSAVQEFRSLFERGHFPGLGYIKKLSIKHHIETLAVYLGR